MLIALTGFGGIAALVCKLGPLTPARLLNLLLSCMMIAFVAIITMAP